MTSNKNQANQFISQSDLDNREPLYGKCEGKFAFTSISSEFATSLLPDDLELAPQEYTNVNEHPLLLMYNNTWLHSNPFLQKISKQHKLDLNLHYNEFIVMLPYVQFKESKYNKDAPFCFLPVLYLDNILAVLGGRIFWEFNKEMAHFKTDAGVYEVRHELSNKLYFTSQFTITDRPILGSSSPNFEAITPILDLPVIEYGHLGYVTSIYKVKYQHEFITPYSLQFTNYSTPYIPDGTFESGSIQSEVLGCFVLNYNWSLSYAKLIKL